MTNLTNLHHCFSRLVFATGFLLGISAAPVLASEPQVVSPNAYKQPFLGVDGTFTLDTSLESSTQDPRNPGRVVFKQMEYFSFYKDMEGKTPLAENCRYVYRGAAGDPFYYPEKSLGSIWDMFELQTSNENSDCNQFKYVILRSPHGDPVHMHLRYGDDKSSFQALLDNSLMAEDEATFNPWWSTYCAQGVSRCDE
ncbi:MAG: hypothetical protein NW237_13005 [Cyanobacteriota bacterium]|nr:hypothetical protein [Cyanobacteriota bacterium]